MIALQLFINGLIAGSLYALVAAGFSLIYATNHFAPVAKEVTKWMDDCWLLMFGYLIRQFSGRVMEINRPEEEIWVTSFFNLNINIMKYARD